MRLPRFTLDVGLELAFSLPRVGRKLRPTQIRFLENGLPASPGIYLGYRKSNGKDDAVEQKPSCPSAPRFVPSKLL
jgi:hypothetical protein